MKALASLLALYFIFIAPSENRHVSADAFNVEEGQNVTLDCPAIHCINASEINFTRGDSVLHTKKILSPRSVKLLLENVSSMHSRRPYTCIGPIQNHRHCVLKIFRVNVFRRPLQPVIIKCIVRDWRWVECSWSPSMAEQLNRTLMRNPYFIHQSLYVRGQQHSLVWLPVNCSTQFDETCRWSLNGSDLDYFRSFDDVTSGAQRSRRQLCFRVDVLNRMLPLASVSSKSHCIDLDEYVLLDAVTTATITTTSASAHLSWKQYSVAPGFQGTILFKISYYSQWIDETEWIEMFSNNSEVDLISLIPNSLYTVRIQVATVGSKIWSEAFDMNFSTEPSVPCQQPEVNANAFHVQSSNKSHRIVYVYWKSISERFRCGDGFGYEVTVTSLDSRRRASYVTNMTSIGVIVGRSHFESRIDILARNNQGFSSLPSASIYIEWQQQKHNHYKDLIQMSAKYKHKKFIVQWDLMNDSPEDRTQLEIFWCERLYVSDQLCRGDLNSLSVSLSDRRIELPLVHTCKMYLIGYAVYSKNRFSDGIHWLDCNYAFFSRSENASVSVDYLEDKEEHFGAIAGTVVGCVVIIILGIIILIVMVCKCCNESEKKSGPVFPPEKRRINPIEDSGTYSGEETLDLCSVDEPDSPPIEISCKTFGGNESIHKVLPTITSEPSCDYEIQKDSNVSPGAISISPRVFTLQHNEAIVSYINVGSFCGSNCQANVSDYARVHDSGGYASNKCLICESKFRNKPASTGLIKSQIMPVELNRPDDMRMLPIISHENNNNPHPIGTFETFCACVLPKIPNPSPSTATESRNMLDFNGVQPNIQNDSLGDVSPSDEVYTLQHQPTKSAYDDSSCGSNSKESIIPQLSDDSAHRDFGYTGGCASNQCFGGESKILNGPAVMLTFPDS